MAKRDRIVGTELEYAISVAIEGEKGYRPLECDSFLANNSLQGQLIKNGSFLSNGGKLYEDQGFLEYATPEESSIEGAVLRELAGERVVMMALANYLKMRPRYRAAYIRKHVIDSMDRTWGYHANHLAERRYIPELTEKAMHLLTLHIITSQAMLGGGTIQQKQQQPDYGAFYYSFGQKALDISRSVDSGTTHNLKPIINTRDQPLANKALYRRIHTTSLDPHISPWAMKMTLGTISLAIRAIEQQKGLFIELDESLHTAPQAARLVAKDLTMQEKLRFDTARGRVRLTALEVQEAILEAVAQTQHTPEEALILQYWQKAVVDLREDPMRLDDRSDAIARWVMIQDWNKRRDYDAENMSTNVAMAASYEYDRIFAIGIRRNPIDTESPMDGYDTSYPNRFRSGVMAAHMPPELDIQKAIHNPPETTRALGRALAIRAGTAGNQVDWDEYQVDGHKVVCADPYAPFPTAEDFVDEVRPSV
ncbi:MAG: proteasome accessory factor PafA2 family protein [Candidatus Saccharimonas sp.]